MNDPVWDLANHSIECNFTNAQEQQLLETYYQTKELPPLIELKFLLIKFVLILSGQLGQFLKKVEGDNFGSYGKNRSGARLEKYDLVKKKEDYHELLS